MAVRVTDNVGEYVVSVVAPDAPPELAEQAADKIQEHVDTGMEKVTERGEAVYVVNPLNKPTRTKVRTVHELEQVPLSKVSGVFMLVVVVCMVNSCMSVFSAIQKPQTANAPSWAAYLPIPGICVHIVQALMMYACVAELDRRLGQVCMCVALLGPIGCVFLPAALEGCNIHVKPALRMWRFKKSNPGRFLAAALVLCNAIQMFVEISAKSGTSIYVRLGTASAEALGQLLLESALNLPEIAEKCSNVQEVWA
jgi:hypothetical protein